MSRRSPSSRDAAWTAERTLQAVRRVVPGSMTGKSPNAAPVRAGRTADVAARRGVAGPAGASVLFTSDRFPSSGTLAAATTSETLTRTPLAGSLHLYLNGLALDEGTDYTLSGATVTLTAGVTAAGDVLEAQYAYSSTAGTVATYTADEAKYHVLNGYPTSQPPAYTVPGTCGGGTMTQAQVNDFIDDDRYYSATFTTEPTMGPMTAAVTCQVSTSGGGSFTPNNLRAVVRDSVTGCLYLTSSGGTSSDTPSITVTPPGSDYSGRYVLVWVGLESYRPSNPDGEPYPCVLEKGVIA